MTAESNMLQSDDCTRDYTAVAACVGGQVVQIRDGRCGIVQNDLAAGQKGSVALEGQFTIPKTTSMVFLDGGKVFWDYSANKAHFKVVSDRDFYVGTVVGDAAAADTTLIVDINKTPVYNADLARDAYLSVPVGTVALNGLNFPYREGGALRFNITATSEAQKVDALGVEGFLPSTKPIIEVAFRMPNGGSGSASDFSIGVANGTNATNADTITDSVFFHLDGGALLINAECDDGTNETAATTTGVSFVAGTALANRVEGWIDMRDLTSVKFYLDGVRVASGTTFSVAAMTNTLFLLAHVEKTTGTETADMTIDWLRARMSNE